MIFIVYSHVIPTTMTLSKWSKIKHLKNKDIKVKENKLTCAVLEMSCWLSQNCLLAFPILYDILLLAQTRIFFFKFWKVKIKQHFWNLLRPSETNKDIQAVLASSCSLWLQIHLIFVKETLADQEQLKPIKCVEIEVFHNLLKYSFNWRIIALQCCVSFCWTIAWISHAPCLFNLPPHHPSPLGCHRARVDSLCYIVIFH